ncbi:hypothetical protein JW992_11420 [candidate division KSB1 bacterium]|nr:hypothetical protein [candidate division KSB1 bacterium]
MQINSSSTSPTIHARSLFCRILALIVLISFADQSFSRSVDVPLDYWGYRFLERAETSGWFSHLAMRNRPISRRNFADILEQIRQRDEQYPCLSKADRGLLAQLRIDFGDELPANSRHTLSERHLFIVEEENGQVYFDLKAGQSIIINRGDRYNPNELLSESLLGGIIRGQLGNTIGFYADVRNSVTRGLPDVQDEDENFDISKGSPVVISGSNVYQDRAVAYFIWEKSWLRIKTGSDELRWGPGQHGNLSISDNMPPAPQIALSTQFSRFRFSSVHAFLHNTLAAKYIAGHRLDLRLGQKFYLGAAETIVYGRRDVEPTYLNPLMLYHVAEHHLGDRDNNSLSIDFTWFPRRGWKLYGEWFIDDMTSTQPLFKYFGNKFAFLLGGMVTAPIGIQDLSLFLEYARIEPYVYSHHDSINIYTHYDKIIGHWLGPNSDTWYLAAGYQLGKDLYLQGSLERLRKGSGKANTRSQPENGTGKKFLDEIAEKQSLFGLQAREQIRRDLFISIGYTFVQTQNANLQAGRRSRDHLIRFELSLNY